MPKHRLSRKGSERIPLMWRVGERPLPPRPYREPERRPPPQPTIVTWYFSIVLQEEMIGEPRTVVFVYIGGLSSDDMLHMHTEYLKTIDAWFWDVWGEVIYAYATPINFFKHVELHWLDEQGNEHVQEHKFSLYSWSFNEIPPPEGVATICDQAHTP